jgi:hypothetical protein
MSNSYLMNALHRAGGIYKISLGLDGDAIDEVGTLAFNR